MGAVRMNKFIVAALLAVLFITMSACSDSTDDSASNQDEPESKQESKEDSSSKDSNVKTDQTESAETSTVDSDTQSMEQEQTGTKIEGRKTEFLEKLDNIQKELDAMPDKKDSDKGVTNAMKNYYGVSYEKYDDALNEIYALLKKELSPEVMKELKAEQLKWIEQKEAKAEKERLKYEGGTFENVAWYISLYESTKERCYELVNEYMTG
jgi:uncharacterized protein YecT (DUF1311 family)